MKILMLVADLDIGGAETHICELIKELYRQKNEVFVASGGGRMVESLAKIGVKHIKIPLGVSNPISMLCSYFRLRRLIRKGGFDVVHSHSRLASFMAERITRNSESAFITTVHAKFSLSPLKKYMTRWGSYTIAVSEDLWEYLRENYAVYSDRTVIISNGVDTSRFLPKEKSGGEVGKKVVFVSRLDADCSKGAYALIAVAKDLSVRYENLNIEIIGGGEEYDNICKMARSVNDELGYVCIITPGGCLNIEEHVAEADAFVGVSRAALEAMSCAVPVILAGNEGFLGEIDETNIEIAEKSNFCARGCALLDEKKLFDSICSVLDMSEEKRAERGDFLREYVIENHSILDMARKTLEVYCARISERSRGYDVCLCGYYGFGNTGDELLLERAIKRAREKFGSGITAFTKYPKADRHRFGVRCVSRSDIFSMIGTIRKSRRLVFGGGTLFQDSTSLRSFFYYALIAEIAIRNGASIEFWGSGLGALESKIAKKLMRRILANSSYVGLRDQKSINFAKELGISGDKVVYDADMALETEACSPERVEYLLGKSGIAEGESFFVVSVSGRCEKYDLDMLETRVASLKGEDKKCIMVGIFPKEDRKISLFLSKKWGIGYMERLSGSELVGLLKRAELACGMRLHLLILSKAAGVDFEGIGRDPKIKSFCEEYGGRYLEENLSKSS